MDYDERGKLEGWDYDEQGENKRVGIMANMGNVSMLEQWQSDIM